MADSEPTRPPGPPTIDEISRLVVGSPEYIAAINEVVRHFFGAATAEDIPAFFREHVSRLRRQIFRELTGYPDPVEDGPDPMTLAQALSEPMQGLIPRGEWENNLNTNPFGISDLRTTPLTDIIELQRSVYEQTGFLKGYFTCDTIAPLDRGELDMLDDSGFIAAICERPDDDVARLTYADWCDDAFSSIGVTLGYHYAARAELIRLQIAMHNGPFCPICHKTGRFRGQWQKWCELQGIPLEGTDVKPDKVVDMECTACDYLASHRRVNYLLDTTYTVGRGSLAPAKIKGRELWKPKDLMTAREVRFVRGFVGIASYTVESYMIYADRMAKAAPLENVVLCDRVLRQNIRPFGKCGYFWVPYDGTKKGEHVQEFRYPGSVIPECLFDLAITFRDKDFPESVTDCYRWLSWAAVHYARVQAKLCEWTPRPADRELFQNLKPGVPQHYFNGSGNVTSLTPELFDRNPELMMNYARGYDGLQAYKGFAAYYRRDIFRGTEHRISGDVPNQWVYDVEGVPQPDPDEPAGDDDGA